MKRYDREKKLEAVVCNRCGKVMKVEGTFPHFDFLEVEKDWGYFSRKDGQVHRFDLCEDCYDAWIGAFQVPADMEEKLELI